jgi:tetratricopeptide (TPR) repeat protein
MTLTAQARRLAPWLLLAGLLAVGLGFGRGALRAAMAHNAGFVALNRALAGDTADATAAVWQARGLAHLTNAAALRPERAATWRAMGYLYLAGGDEAQAVAAWQRAGEILPELRASAEEAEQAGDNDAAREWYGRMTAVAPEEPVAWLELGLFYERQGDWAAAAEAFDWGIARATTSNSDILYHLGLARRNLPAPDWAAILSLTDRALAADAYLHDWSRVQTYSLRGEALLALDRPAEARDEFARVVAQQPDDFWATLRLARLVWSVDGDAATAERLFRAALALDAQSKWAYLGLAQLYADQGRADQARPLFQRVREIDPADTMAAEWLAQN